jgi:hypothetical protein
MLHLMFPHLCFRGSRSGMWRFVVEWMVSDVTLEETVILSMCSQPPIQQHPHTPLVKFRQHISYYTVFWFTATFNILQQTALHKQWRYIGGLIVYVFGIPNMKGGLIGVWNIKMNLTEAWPSIMEVWTCVGGLLFASVALRFPPGCLPIPHPTSAVRNSAQLPG